MVFDDFQLKIVKKWVKTDAAGSMIAENDQNTSIHNLVVLPEQNCKDFTVFELQVILITVIFSDSYNHDR